MFINRNHVSARLLASAAMAALLGIYAAPPAPAQDVDVVPMSEWDNDAVYVGGVSVRDLLYDADVYGPDGDEIGSVENVIFGADGSVLSIIAQVGGLWDIGDTHVNVPWDQVQVRRDDDEYDVTIPVREDTVDDYTLYQDEVLTRAGAANLQVVDDDLETDQRAWRATELIGDYARLKGEAGAEFRNYGYVHDAIVKDGKLSAVIVRPDVSYGTAGYYAYPYYGYRYGWHPGVDYYDTRYGTADIGELEPFDYDRLGD